jgi:hypothetical protein
LRIYPLRCALWKNISKKGPQNRRSLGFARDDKKGRAVERKGQLLKERAVIDEKGVPPHIRSPLTHPIL